MVESDGLTQLINDYETVLEKVLDGLRIYAVCSFCEYYKRSDKKLIRVSMNTLFRLSIFTKVMPINLQKKGKQTSYCGKMLQNPKLNLRD